MVRFICSAPELFFRSSTNPVEQQMKMVQADRSEPGADVNRWNQAHRRPCRRQE
jgi:hypothetical protein